MFKGENPEVNLHVFSFDCKETECMTAFRDRLRTDKEDRLLYADRKRQLAARGWKYVQEYADANFFCRQRLRQGNKQHINHLEQHRLQSRAIGSVKNPNCRFTCIQILQLLVLFPFFLIRNAVNYSSSALGKVFICHQDMFYRFTNDGKVNWRGIIYSVYRQLYSRVSRKTASKPGFRCVIIDDTDLPKTGFRTEKIGKVFSHIQMKPIPGFKAIFSCLTDGVSYLFDFSLHGEEEKRGDRPQGLSRKQVGTRYCKGHSEDEHIARRSAKYFASKIETAISMLRRSIMKGVRFDYLLVDNWGTCSELLKFMVSRHFECHLLVMIKMGKTMYETGLGNKIRALWKSWSVKCSCSIGYYTATASAKLSGIKVNLFFYRRSKNGNWNALLTSDLELDARKPSDSTQGDGSSKRPTRR